MAHQVYGSLHRKYVGRLIIRRERERESSPSSRVSNRPGHPRFNPPLDDQTAVATRGFILVSLREAPFLSAFLFDSLISNRRRRKSAPRFLGILDFLVRGVVEGFPRILTRRIVGILEREF